MSRLGSDVVAISTLRAAKQDLQERLRKLSADVRIEQKKSSRGMCHRSTLIMELKACVALHGGARSIARLYFDAKQRQKARGRSWQSFDVELDTWWTNLTPQERVAWTSQVMEEIRHCDRVAVSFARGQALHDWLHRQNVFMAVAPTSTTLLAVSENPLTVPGSALRRYGSGKSRLQWLRRWRSKWNVRLAHVLPRPAMTDEEAQQKVDVYGVLSPWSHQESLVIETIGGKSR